MPIDLRVLAMTDCRNGDCPALHVDDTTGDVFVQGYLPAPDTLSVPAGEGLLRIPAAAWAELIAQLGR